MVLRPLPWGYGHYCNPAARRLWFSAKTRSSNSYASIVLGSTDSDAINSLSAAGLGSQVKTPIMGLSPSAKESETQGTAKVNPALLEGLGLLLLSLATVGTAWCSFEAAAWGGAAAGAANQSTAASRRAAKDELQANQMALLDILLFSQHINARASSNEPLARFYADRFRGEAKTAFEAWMALKPFENSNAPPHPFVTNLYQPRVLEDARQADAESQRFAEQAGDAGRNSRSYILITVLLASALFCGGTAAKFDRSWVRRGVLMFGLGAFLFAMGRLWQLPIQF